MRLFLLIFISLSFLSSSSWGQEQTMDPLPISGVYLAYVEDQIYTELILNDDGSFSYTDNLKYEGKLEREGEWEIKRGKVVLKRYKAIRPHPRLDMPKKWKIENNELSAVMNKRSPNSFLFFLEKQNENTTVFKKKRKLRD